MSSEALPITPARFAEAIKELPAASLALKVAELRNSIAHLDYSNAELRPFALGTARAVSSSSSSSSPSFTSTLLGAVPDEDCVDAIHENNQVIGRMQERIALIRTEVESRGLNWREFSFKDENTTEGEEEEQANNNNNNTTTTTNNGSSGGDGVHDLTGARTHGLVNGVVGPNGAANGQHHIGTEGSLNETRAQAQTQTEHAAWRDGTFQTGTIRGLSDEDIIRGLTERVAGFGTNQEDNDEDDDAGLHL